MMEENRTITSITELIASIDAGGVIISGGKGGQEGGQDVLILNSEIYNIADMLNGFGAYKSPLHMAIDTTNNDMVSAKRVEELSKLYSHVFKTRPGELFECVLRKEFPITCDLLLDKGAAVSNIQAKEYNLFRLNPERAEEPEEQINNLINNLVSRIASKESEGAETDITVGVITEPTMKASFLLTKIDDGAIIEARPYGNYLITASGEHAIPTQLEGLYGRSILNKALDTREDAKAIQRVTELLKICDVNDVDSDGWPALFAAVQNDLAQTVYFLLQNGANPNFTDNDGNNVGAYINRGNNNIADMISNAEALWHGSFESEETKTDISGNINEYTE